MSKYGLIFRIDNTAYLSAYDDKCSPVKLKSPQQIPSFLISSMDIAPNELIFVSIKNMAQGFDINAVNVRLTDQLHVEVLDLARIDVGGMPDAVELLMVHYADKNEDAIITIDNIYTYGLLYSEVSENKRAHTCILHKHQLH